MAGQADHSRGRTELAQVRSESRGLFVAVGVFSMFVNLLMLTGPLFMLQVYDRVLGSRSESTLLALTLLMGFLFVMMGLLDLARSRVLGRIGARFQSRLDRRVFEAMVRAAAVNPQMGGRNHLSDLESVQRLLASPVLGALFDLPWTPLFLGMIFVFHPLLGWLALSALILLTGIAVLNQLMSRSVQAQAQSAQIEAHRMSEQVRQEA